MRLAVPIPIDLPLQITCYVADAQAAKYDGTSPRSTRFSVGTGSSWDAEYNLCAVAQLVTSGRCNWILCIKRYPSGVCP